MRRSRTGSTGTRLTKRTLIKFIRNAFLPILANPSSHSTTRPLVSHYKIFIRFLLYITTQTDHSCSTAVYHYSFSPSLFSATDIYSNSNFSSPTTLLLLLLLYHHHQDQDQQPHCSLYIGPSTRLRVQFRMQQNAVLKNGHPFAELPPWP